jgi:hypothetical protein
MMILRMFNVTIGKAVVLLGLLSLACSAVPIRADDAPEEAKKECAVAAFTDYNKRLLALLQDQTKQLLALQSTVKITMARRRLQEQYCMQFAGCLFPTPQLNCLPFNTHRLLTSVSVMK